MAVFLRMARGRAPGGAGHGCASGAAAAFRAVEAAGVWESKGSMNTYVVLLVVFGTVVLLTAWLPMLLKELPLSLPIVCVAIGMGLAWSPLSRVVAANPLENLELTKRLTEIVVIVSLMGAGLKLDRPVGWRAWAVTWRLIGLAMPLTIGAIALVGWGLLKLPPADALLLGAALAPTDPVLASDVQVGPPRSIEETGEDELRFALTSEAGLNDGAAFPFVFLAIALAHQQTAGEPFLAHWLVLDVFWKIAAGVGLGWLFGKAMGFLTFRLPNRAQISRTGDGFVALGITCLVYGATELVHGYGFVAVFVAALTLRAAERGHSYHEHLHSFSEQVERLLMMVLLVCFGAAIAEGTIFGALSWKVAAAAGLILFVVRPACGWIGLLGHDAPPATRAAIAFFGIRGLGSFFYVAYATEQGAFAEPALLWITVCLVVAASIAIHGTAVTPVMRRLDRTRLKRLKRLGKPGSGSMEPEKDAGAQAT